MLKLAFSLIFTAPAFAQPGVNFGRLAARSGAPAVPAVRAEAQSSELPEWTIMVYANAKSNLANYGLADLNEMETVGSTGKVQVVMELARITWNPSVKDNWAGARRYFITKDSDTTTISSPIVQTLEKPDMGDWRHLADFAKWAKANYPAKHYMLVIWNHGDGWKKGFTTQSISEDPDSGHRINTPDLGLAMKEMGKVDVLAFDACLMQMLEIAYEVKDYADYVAGSEEGSPMPGYAYDGFLSLVNKSDLSPLSVGKAVVESYHDYYLLTSENTTISLLKTAALPIVVSELNSLLDSVRAANKKGNMLDAAMSTTSFDIMDNKDLLRFLQMVYFYHAVSEAVKTRSSAIINDVSSRLVQASKVTGLKYGSVGGVAIYLPTTYYNADYDELAFAKDSKWPAFLKWLNAPNSQCLPCAR